MTRVLLKSANLEAQFWPVALRHAGEFKFRKHLEKFGLRMPKLLPFGTQVMVKRKTWKMRGEAWRWPMEKAVVLGPAEGMSATSNAHWVQAMRMALASGPPLLFGQGSPHLLRMVCWNARGLPSRWRTLMEMLWIMMSIPVPPLQKQEFAAERGEFLRDMEQVGDTTFLMEELVTGDQGRLRPSKTPAKSHRIVSLAIHLL